MLEVASLEGHGVEYSELSISSLFKLTHCKLNGAWKDSSDSRGELKKRSLWGNALDVVIFVNDISPAGQALNYDSEALVRMNGSDVV